MRATGDEEKFRQQDEPSPDRWRFLAEAGQAFAASLDLDSTLRTAVDFATPALADFVCIDLLEDECMGCLPADGPAAWLRRLASGHRDPGRQADEVAGACPVRSQAAHPTVRAIVSGQPVLVQRSEEAQPEPGSPVPAIGATALFGVPLRANGRILGAMLFGAQAGRLSTREERAVAVAFADRVALALNGALLYAQARSATRLRDDVIGSISHDLRNPLNVMTMVVDALRRDLGDPGERMQRRFDAMQRSSERMTRLIDELLDATRNNAAVRRSPDEAPRSPR